MRNILVTCVGIIVGIAISSALILRGGISSWFLVSLFLSVCIFVDAWFFQKISTRVYTYRIFLFLLGLCFGLFRVGLFNHSILHGLEKFEEQNVVMKGQIINSSVSNGLTQKFVVAVFSAAVAPNTVVKSQKTIGYVLVSADIFPTYHYGDVVQIRGKIKKPKKIDDGTGLVFDYPRFLLKDGVTEMISFASVKVIGPNTGNSVVRFLYGIREAFVKAIGRLLPEPEAGLLSGIVLGTQTVAPSLSNNFRIAGLSHIVVLSGYNITIVAETLMSLVLYASPAAAPFVTVGGVILFVVMSGAGASSVRAGIMAVVAVLGRRFSKTYNAGRALFFASFLMVLWNPFTLPYDPSFHLSFLATFAMIYVSPLTLARLQMITQRFGLQEILSTTLAVTLFVLPYIVFMAGKIAVYSILANMIILPLVPLTMGIGLLTAVFGFLWYPLLLVGFLPGIVSYGITRYDIFIANGISRLPFAQITYNHFSLGWLVLTYTSFAVFYYFCLRPEIISEPG